MDRRNGTSVEEHVFSSFVCKFRIYAIHVQTAFGGSEVPKDDSSRETILGQLSLPLPKGN